LTYCKNGFWIPPVGICQPITETRIIDSCKPLNFPSNGKVYYIYNNYTKDYQVGTTAVLVCNKGFRLEGEATLICDENGWTPHDGFGNCVSADDNFRNFHKYS
uniref:Sushi domain-containing protein n=1 Tax=Onchocerca flexuosa TaxID=387005 RepID=A0A183HS15_9BILA